MSHASTNWLSLELALEQIQSLAHLTLETELVPLATCCGRVLAEPIDSPIDVPAFANSAMDGYAIRFDDVEQCETLTIIGESFAGTAFNGTVGRGQCVRIMTGAVLPEGADTVVMQENTVVNDNAIRLTDSVRRAEAVRPIGNDIRLGCTVLEKHKLMTSLDIGLLASLGIASVLVYKPLRVAVFSTGDELTVAGEPLKPGHIYDSNRPMLLSMLQQSHYEVVDFGIIPDQKQALRDAFARANHCADIVICSGGVSVGEADYTKQILAEVGQVDFWKIAIKPGKPLAIGRLSNSLFIGLPGNPVSAMVTYLQIAEHALDLMSGLHPEPHLRLPATANEDFRKRPGRLDFQRAFCWVDDRGELRVKPSGNQSSGVLSSFSKSNCFAVLEKERGLVEAGERVMIELLDHRVHS